MKHPIIEAPLDGEWMVLYRPNVLIGTGPNCVIGCWVEKYPDGDPLGAWCWSSELIDFMNPEQWRKALENEDFYCDNTFTHFTPIAQTAA